MAPIIQFFSKLQNVTHVIMRENIFTFPWSKKRAAISHREEGTREGEENEEISDYRVWIEAAKREKYLLTYLLTYLLHGAESFLRS